jgi:hypothetical protein
LLKKGAKGSILAKQTLINSEMENIVEAYSDRSVVFLACIKSRSVICSGNIDHNGKRRFIQNDGAEKP